MQQSVGQSKDLGNQFSVKRTLASEVNPGYVTSDEVTADDAA